MMKDTKGTVDFDRCMDLHKAALLHKASDASLKNNKAVTVLTYLHGVRESLAVIEQLQQDGFDIDLIELRSLKPLDINHTTITPKNPQTRLVGRIHQNGRSRRFYIRSHFRRIV